MYLIPLSPCFPPIAPLLIRLFCSCLVIVFFFFTVPLSQKKVGDNSRLSLFSLPLYSSARCPFPPPKDKKTTRQLDRFRWGAPIGRIVM